MTSDPDGLISRIAELALRVSGKASLVMPAVGTAISPSASLQDLGVHYYLLFRFVRELENEFQIRIGDADLDYSRFDTVGDVARLVRSYERGDAH